MSQEQQWVDKKKVEWIKVFAPPSAYEKARFLPSPFHLRLIIQQITSFPAWHSTDEIPDEIPATPKSAEAVVEIENVLNMRSDYST